MLSLAQDQEQTGLVVLAEEMTMPPWPGVDMDTLHFSTESRPVQDREDVW